MDVETFPAVISHHMGKQTASDSVFNEDLCWKQWTETHDQNAREQLISHYLPYARIVTASYYRRRTHDEVEFAEYLQLASVGLLEAIDRFDYKRPVQFKTFAAKRMHGSILNGLERLTEKNQQIALKKKLREERVQALREDAKLNADSLEGEPKSSQTHSSEDVFRYLAEVGIGLALGMLLADTGMMEPEDVNVAEVGISPEVSYFRQSETKQLQRLMRELVMQLPKQEQTVIRYHYLQEIGFDEIAINMGVTKGRVSQIHRQALLHLRNVLHTHRRCDVVL